MANRRKANGNEQPDEGAVCPHRKGCKGTVQTVIVELETCLCARHFVELHQAPGAWLSWDGLTEEQHEQLSEERELRDHLSDEPFWKKPTRR